MFVPGNNGGSLVAILAFFSNMRNLGHSKFELI